MLNTKRIAMWILPRGFNGVNSFSGKGRTNKTNGGSQALSRQTVGSLLRTPWLADPAGKVDSARSQFDQLCVNLCN